MNEIAPGDGAPGQRRAGRWARLGRALGDIFLTAGMSKGLLGDRSEGDSRPATNVILFGEGDGEGHEADRGSGQP
jgi:hypothetical protein